jgi:uncharacterized membrane protein
MFNKNFFLGMLTMLLVIVVLAIGGVTLRRAINPDSAALAGGRFDRSQIEFDDDFSGGAPAEFQGEAREGGHGHASFSPLRGIGGLIGGLFKVGVIVGLVLGGQWLVKRFTRRPTPPPGVDGAVSPPPPPVESEPADVPAEAGPSPEM